METNEKLDNILKKVKNVVSGEQENKGKSKEENKKNFKKRVSDCKGNDKKRKEVASEFRDEIKKVMNELIDAKPENPKMIAGFMSAMEMTIKEIEERRGKVSETMDIIFIVATIIGVFVTEGLLKINKD